MSGPRKNRTVPGGLSSPRGWARCASACSAVSDCQSACSNNSRAYYTLVSHPPDESAQANHRHGALRSPGDDQARCRRVYRRFRALNSGGVVWCRQNRRATPTLLPSTTVSVLARLPSTSETSTDHRLRRSAFYLSTLETDSKSKAAGLGAHEALEPQHHRTQLARRGHASAHAGYTLCT